MKIFKIGNIIIVYTPKKIFDKNITKLYNQFLKKLPVLQSPYVFIIVYHGRIIEPFGKHINIYLNYNTHIALPLRDIDEKMIRLRIINERYYNKHIIVLQDYYEIENDELIYVIRFRSPLVFCVESHTILQSDQYIIE